MSEKRAQATGNGNFPTFRAVPGRVVRGAKQYFPTLKRMLASVFPWRGWRIMAKGILLLIILAGLWNLVGSLYMGGKVRARVRALKAAGKPVSAPELARQPVPEAQNAWPLYERAAELTKAHDTAGPGVAYGYCDLDPGDQKTIAGIAELLKADQAAVSLIAEGTQRPECYVALDWSVPPWEILLPHYADLRRLARVPRCGAIVASTNGDQALALDRLRQGLVLSRHASPDDILISMLVAVAMDNFAADAAQYVLPRGDLPRDEALALADELGSMDCRDLAAKSLDSERAAGLTMYRVLDQLDGSADDLVDTGSWAVSGRLPLWMYTRLARPLWYRDQLRYLDYLEWSEGQLTLSPVERGPAMPSRDDVLREGWGPVSQVLTPAMDKFIEKAEVALVGRDLFRTAIGIELYQDEHGEYPPDLQAVRQMGWDVPVDIYSEADFVYERRGDTYYLRSLGPDLKDDGGEPFPWPSQENWKRRIGRKVEPADDTDIVWTVDPPN